MGVSHIRSSTWFMVVALGFAVFTEQWLYCAVSPVFPTALTNRFGVKPEQVQKWVDSLFGIEAAGLLVAAPIIGYLSDRIAKRKAFLVWGTFILLGAHAIQAFVRNTAALMVGRLIQGSCAAIVWGVGLALVADRTPSDKTGEMMGYVSAPFNAAAVAGPVLGGIIYGKVDYLALFAIGFALIAVTLGLLLMLPEPNKKKTLLLPGAPAFVAESCVIVPEPVMRSISISTMRTEHIFSIGIDTETQSVSSAFGSKSEEHSSWDGSTASTIWERLQSSPLLMLLKSWQLWATFLANVVNAMILPGFDVTLPLFAEETYGWSSLGTGLLFLALAIPGLFQPLLGRIVDRLGPRWPVTFGLLLCIAPFGCLKFVNHDSTQQVVLLCVLLATIGFGTSLSLAATMADFCAIAETVEEQRPNSMGKGGAYAQAYIFFNVSWAVGELVGSNVAGLMRRGNGWGVMGWSYMGICGAGALVALLFCDGWIGNAKLQHRRRKLTPGAGSS